MGDEIERIVRAAARDESIVWSVPRPGRHHHLFALQPPAPPDAEQGFLTSDGRFVDRVEGLLVATAAGQITAKHGNPHMLFSEDMW